MYRHDYTYARFKNAIVNGYSHIHSFAQKQKVPMFNHYQQTASNINTHATQTDAYRWIVYIEGLQTRYYRETEEISYCSSTVISRKT